MVNDSLSSVRSSSSSKSSEGASNSSNSNSAQNIGTDNESSNFSSILGKAKQPKVAAAKADVKTDARTKAVAKLDKPKVGSRDPFFPATPVPYHPDESRSQASSEVSHQPSRDRDESVEGLPTDQMRSKSEVGISRARLDHKLPESGNVKAPGRVQGVGQRNVDSIDDDEDGVMSDSYDGAAVSYPISRIAQESLDDDTKEDLQAQGLWNLPTMVMAQPNSKLASMNEAAQGAQNVKGVGMRESSVPVQKPIAQFMASLENDLGVSPDRLVQAFQKLPAGQMALPPEQTMVQVVKNLGLSKDEESGAMQAYSKMLAQMQMLDKPERLQAAPLVMGGLTTGKVEQQIEIASLVKPEAKSVAGKYSMQAPEGVIKAEGQSEFGNSMNMSTVKSEAGFKNGVAGYEGLKGARDSSSSFGNQIGMQNVEVKGQSQNNSSGQGQAFDQNLAGQNPSGQNLDGQNLGNQNQAASQGFGESATFAAGQSHEAKAVNAKEVSFDVKRDLGKDVAVKSATVSATGDSVNLNSGAPAGQAELKPLQNTGAPVIAGATGAAAELKSESQARHEAIQHIVSNAQLLAQRGGGEMKLTFKPDHMGEIQLRVAMEGNKVNVQMTAEKSEVKKLIEQSVHELRSGLAQHNFSMEKLDVSLKNNDAGNQFQGKQPDFGAAQDFFSQFHQQQGNRRQMMAGMSELSSPIMRKAQNPGMSASSFAPGAAARAMGSSRLNVVA